MSNDADLRIRIDRGAAVVEGGVECAPFVPPGVRAHVHAALRELACLADAGMLDGPAARDAMPPRIDVHATGPSAWRIVGHNLDIGAYRMLVNLLCGPDTGRGAGLRVHLGSASAREGDSDGASLARVPYPGRAAAEAAEGLPQAVELVGLHPVIRLTFAQALDEPATVRLFSWLGAWEWVVCHDGFSRAGSADSHPALASSERYLVAPDTVEYALTGWTGPREAFWLLANMAVRLRGQEPVLRTLELQPD